MLETRYDPKVTAYDMLLHVFVQLLKGLLDGGGVVAVEDGVDGLGDIGVEPGPLLPLLRRAPSIEKVRSLLRLG